jgi:4,5-DOPA dioxygenase extradiol
VTVQSKMPALFVGHGSPTNALERNRFTTAWRALGASLPRPKVVLAISAHWYVEGLAVTAMARPRTIHDFYGFPRELYQIDYPAPGDAGFAHRVRDLLGPGVALDEEWGLDHGTWSVLIHLFPVADVPVVQLSIDAMRAPAFHYQLGQQLALLRSEGVLILGSGNIVHNLRRIVWSDDATAYPWAAAFDAQVRDCVLRRDHGTLIDYGAGEAGALSVPTPDHYLPLLYVLGTQDPADPVSFPVEGLALGSISMRSVLVGG